MAIHSQKKNVAMRISNESVCLQCPLKFLLQKNIVKVLDWLIFYMSLEFYERIILLADFSYKFEINVRFL